MSAMGVSLYICWLSYLFLGTLGTSVLPQRRGAIQEEGKHFMHYEKDNFEILQLAQEQRW